MPITLRAQQCAVEAARRYLLGGPKPRRPEAEEIAKDLEEAVETLRYLDLGARQVERYRASDAGKLSSGCET